MAESDDANLKLEYARPTGQERSLLDDILGVFGSVIRLLIGSFLILIGGAALIDAVTSIIHMRMPGSMLFVVDREDWWKCSLVAAALLPLGGHFIRSAYRRVTGYRPL